MNVCFAPEGMEANIYSIYTEEVRETILRCGEMAVNNINYTGSGELVFSVSDPTLVTIGSETGTMYMLQTGTVIVTCTAADEGISASYVLNMVDTSDDNVTKIPQDLTNYY
ncbi:MAG: hypothetical protein LUE15_03210 [Oscillospiraceae bacterium]|nr:hypothetical protein [Oscillospiraceae bacterium]